MWLSQLAAELGLEYSGEDFFISGVNTLDKAGPEELSFLASPKYRQLLETTKAGAVILAPADANSIQRCLISNNPYLDFARAMHSFARPQGLEQSRMEQAFIHPSAEVDPAAVVHPMVFIGEKARIGSGSRIFPHVYIGERVQIGRDCIIYPQASIMSECVVGDRAVIHSGAVIGSDGFGFVEDGKRRIKIPQLGRVVIEEDVEIGACTTIDRATLGETRIGQGTKIDNLVQVAHNVQVDQNCVLVAQVGISGSTKLGRNVILGGQAGVAGHLNIEDNCRVAAKSGLGKSLPANTDVGGIPAMEHSLFLRNAVLLPKLPQMYKSLKKLEKEIQILKQSKQGDDL